MKRQEINVDFPEEHFPEGILEKAFRLFRNNLVEFEGREKSVYHFLVGGKTREDVRITLSKNLIKNHSCTCGKSNCMHVCASVFYLRRENYSTDTVVGFSGGNEKIFKGYEKKLTVTQKDDLHKLLTASQKSGSKDEKVFFLLSGLVYFLRRRDFKFSEEDLDLVFSEMAEIKLNEKHSGFLLFTIKESLKSERKFDSTLWFYLIPFLERFRNRLITEDLKNLFNQRKLKNFFPGNINMKDVALSVLNSPSKPTEGEDFVARAMVLFSQKNNREAFKILERGLQSLKKSRSVSLGGYIRFVLRKAQQYHRSRFFLNYAKELFLVEPFIDPLFYKKISELLTDEEKQKFYCEVIDELRNKPNRQELIFEIQFQNGLWTDLVKEIKARNGKFFLLNKAALALLPELNPDLLNFYPLSLVNALNSAPDGNYRNFLFDEAALFLKRIPLISREIIIEKILEKLGGKDHLAARFLKLLNPPA